MDILNFFTQHSTIFLGVVALISLIIGSFLNVVIYRLPRMIQSSWNQECREYLGLKPTKETELFNLSLPFSHCTNCKTRLKPWHNIPIISYLVLKGRCSFCKSTISIRYPFVELLCCVTSLYTALRFGISLQLVGGLLFTWILICLTFIDLDYHLLPDNLTLLLLWIGLLLSVFSVFIPSHHAIIGAIAGYLIFAIIQYLFKLTTGKIGMGQGDFKLLAALGAYVGWQMLPIIILLASVSGLIFGLTYIALKHQFKSVPLPFGPYLAVAGWVALLWGNEILQLYLHKFVQ